MSKPQRISQWLTVQEILDDLGISRRTWQRWRALGRTPTCKRPSGGKRGQLRIRRADYEAWLESIDSDAA